MGGALSTKRRLSTRIYIIYKLAVGESVSYYYNGQKYTGVILKMDVDHDVVNAHLSEIHKKWQKSHKKETVSESPLKRRVSTRNNQSATASTSTSKRMKKDTKVPMTEEEKNRLQLLELKKNEAEKLGNQQILQKSVEKPKDDFDPEWRPEGTDVETFDHDESSQDSLENLVPGTKMSKEKSVLLSTMKHVDKGQDFSCTNTCRSSNVSPHLYKKSTLPCSPSMEELKQKERLQLKLQVAHDAASTSRKNLPNSSGSKCDEIFLKKREGSSEGDLFLGSDASLDDDLSKVEFKEKTEQTVKADDSKEYDLLDFQDDQVTRSLNYQLHGKVINPFLQDTTHLCRQVYCKTDVLTKAFTNSNNVKHLIRRLMVGVFIPSKIIDCTATGQSWHAGGQDTSSLAKKPLHPGALHAIADFANSVGKKKNWQLQRFHNLTPTFSTRLGEIRKQVFAGKLAD